MNALNLEMVNSHAEYPVFLSQTGKYVFKTDVLLYMCSTDNGQQAMRNRLFLRWFNGYEQQKHYLIRSTEVRSIGPDNKPIKEYIALIIQRSNPQFDEIVSRFDSEIAMFNELKP